MRLLSSAHPMATSLKIRLICPAVGLSPSRSPFDKLSTNGMGLSQQHFFSRNSPYAKLMKPFVLSLWKHEWLHLLSVSIYLFPRFSLEEGLYRFSTLCPALIQQFQQSQCTNPVFTIQLHQFLKNSLAFLKPFQAHIQKTNRFQGKQIQAYLG